MNTATLFFMKYGDKGGKTELSLDEKKYERGNESTC